MRLRRELFTSRKLEIVTVFAHLIFSQVTFVDNKHKEGQELASVQTTVGHGANEATPDPLQKLGLSSKGFDSLTPGWPVSSFRNNQTDE